MCRNQVAPAELEGILRLHPHVEDAAVCGKYVPTQGTEFPIAYIVTKGHKSHDTKLLHHVLAFVNERVSTYKRIKDIRVIEEIPRKYVHLFSRTLLSKDYGAKEFR